MNIPEFLKKLGNTPDAIIKAKTSGEKQTRDFSSTSEVPTVVTMSMDECKSLCKDIGVEYVKGYESRVLRYVCSDQSCDRMGDVIKQDGWDLKNFKTNPVIMANHNYGAYPVGNALTVKVVEGKLKMDVLFAGPDVSEDADKAFKLAKAGFMKAGSVGFIPKAHHKPTEAECVEYGMQKDSWGVVFDENELLEYSVCGVPANANALQESIGKGLVCKSDFKPFITEERFNELEEKEVTLTNPTLHKDFDLDAVAKGTHEIRIVGGEFKTVPLKEIKEKSLDSATIESIIDKKLGEHKAGAVISKKNKKLINDVIATMGAASEALKALLDIKEEQEDTSTEGKNTDESEAFELNLDDVDELNDDETLYKDENFEVKL